MYSGIYVVNLCMASAAFMLSVMSLLSSVINRSIRPWVRRFFLVFFSVLLIHALSNLLSLVAISRALPALFTRLMFFVKMISAALLLPLAMEYLLHSSGQSRHRHSRFYIVLGLFILDVIIIVIAFFSRRFYYFSPDSRFHRGPLYPLLLICPVIILVICMVELIRVRFRLNKRQLTGFYTYFTLPTIALLLHIRFSALFLIELSSTLSATLLYLINVHDQSAAMLREQEENARQRASILVLQMRPHFIYNTMMSIYYLCRQDPEKAQQVVLRFSSYLRHNFSALAKSKMIPFEEELEHTRAYLDVELVRHEEQLYVEYDLPFTRFSLPPLTLQPIVENAVKYGVDPDSAPLTVCIRTRSTAEGSLIEIEDNGPGFRETDNGEPHMALDNIRERLALTCGGALEISARPGGGTVVTVTVPEKS